MGITDKFEMIAEIHDTPEQVEIAKLSSDAKVCISWFQTIDIDLTSSNMLNI